MNDPALQPSALPPLVPSQPVRPTLAAILRLFLTLGATAFGGGNAGWMHRETVERRGWLSEEEFLRILTVAQVMPGANPVNLAVSIGLHLRGYAGAALAGFGIVAPAFAIILLLGALYTQASGHALVHFVLAGLACVGIATSLVMGIKTARRLKGEFVPVVVAVAVFVSVGILRWPLVWVVLAATPASIAMSYWLHGRKRHG